jgi:hypothetical protein
LRVDAAALDWYLDSSHFSQKTAELALDCIFQSKDCARLDGTQLWPETIDARLGAIRENRMKWLARDGIEADLELLSPAQQ